MSILRPYAITIDTGAYTVAKFFEVGIAASCVAQATKMMGAQYVGTFIWIMGALFVACWQSVRAYQKAQYNSTQNEFFITSADGSDFALHELGDDTARMQEEMADVGEDPNSPNASGGDGGGMMMGGARTSTLQSLFPDGDYDEEDEEFLADGRKHNLLMPNNTAASNNNSRRPVDSDEDYDDSPASSPRLLATQRPHSSSVSAGAPAATTNNQSFTISSSGSGRNRKAMNNNNNKSVAGGGASAGGRVDEATIDSDDDIVAQYRKQKENEQSLLQEDSKMMNEAPRLQLGDRGNLSNSSSGTYFSNQNAIPDAVGDHVKNSADHIPDENDPLHEFWDALSANQIQGYSQHNAQQKQQAGNNGYSRPHSGSLISNVSTTFSTPASSAYGGGASGGIASRSSSAAHSQQPQHQTFVPKIAVRDVAHQRKIPEANPCRMTDSIEAPTVGNDSLLNPQFVNNGGGDAYMNTLVKNANVAEDGVGVDL
jgi:hypothetical protein